MDELIKQMTQFSDLSSSFSLLDVAAVFFLSFGLSLVVGWVYRSTHKGVSYSQSYVHTLVILGIVVAFIMLIVGSNIARAFTLVGALSIIRFRHAVKETRDIGFVFMVMAIGMACGTRFYLLAVFATLAMSSAVIVMTKFSLFRKVIRERILIARVVADVDYRDTFSDVFERNLEEFHLISVESVREATQQEAIWSVVLRSGVNPTVFLEEVRRASGNLKASLVLGQQELDL